jgi:predicted MFS family arabinose efflux permease
MCYYAVYAATPFFRDTFGLSRFHVGIVITVLSLGYIAFLLPIGMMTDRYGERRTLTLGLGGLAVAATLVTVAPNYAGLLVTTFVLGSFYGTAMPGTNKAIYDHISPGRQNLAIGIKQVGVTAGSGASVLLVTGFSGILSWESGFWAAGLFAGGVAVLFYLFYSDNGGGSEVTYPDYRALLQNRPYQFLVVAGLFLGAAFFTTVAYTVLYIEESVGATVVFGGIVLAFVQVSGSLGRVVMGWLGDVLPGEPQRRIGLLLLGQTSASAVLLVAVSLTSSPLVSAFLFVLLGFFVLGFTGIYYSCMATLVRSSEIGSATAGGQLALTTGGLVGPPVYGHLADAFGYRAGWWLLAGGCVIASLFFLLIVSTEPPVEEVAVTN